MAPEPVPKLPPRVVLAEHKSLPLEMGVKVINKSSQNLHAEMLLRTLAKELKGFGSLTVGIEVLEEYVVQIGLDRKEFHFADGSGLSSDALVAPQAVIKLLAHMNASPQSEVFRDSLPIAGADGTLEDRLKGSEVRARIRAKTGTMTHTNALSGYMDLPRGQRLAFCIIGNHHGLSPRQGATVVDRIVIALYQHFARGAAKK